MKLLRDQVGLPALGIAGLAVLLFVGGGGMAQEATRSRPAGDRTTGIPAGSLRVFPEITVEEEYNDNITFVEDSERSDFITRLGSTIAAETQWSRHALQARIFGELERHADNTDADTEKFGATMAGRIDVSRATTIDSAVTVERNALDRRDEDNEGGLEPRKFDRLSADVGVRVQPNRIGVEAGLAVQRSDFLDQADDDKDRTQTAVRARLSYEVGADLDLFVEPFARFEEFDEQEAGVDRSRKTIGSLAGARFDVTGLVTGEAAAGVFREEFDDPGFDDRTSFALEGAVNWDVTERTRLRGAVSRRDEATTVDGAASKVTTSISLRAAHELNRSLTAEIGGTYSNDSFQGITREDDDFRVDLGGQYEINRRFSVGARYTFSKRDSDVADESFVSNIASVRIKGQF